ncbi:efflux RND transporter periplasmic adaptor subunit [Vibrio sp. YMD68]|uniref:efflux RND transporter periplasmic adaptor subunit n=1 Tax=Vibrio sp. YMD68 TaxID=3042300 RepID=UPI00249CCFED|nr:efflux RND transporter periplasmic adaptor subunit [Vibrio sp. YMD68]WGV98944.1 efflux RND transporter periplasmic adaptor subunit [Vibrio sp. YMD68]
MPHVSPSRILLSFSLLLMSTGCSTEDLPLIGDTPRPVRLTEVQPVGHQEIRRFPAQVSASKEVELAFRVGGEVVEFNLKPSQRVTKGEVIARLDQRDFKTEVVLKTAEFDLVKREFNRATQMMNQNLLAQAEFDGIQARLQVAQGALQLAQDRLKDTVITAPYSGRIATTHIENHQQIQAHQGIVILQDHEMIDLTIQLPESILSQMNAKRIDPYYQPLATFNGSSVSYPVIYKQHKTQATTGTQSYEVTFTLVAPTDNHTVYPGMGATLHLDLDKVIIDKQEVKHFVVPASAILDNDMIGQSQVWVFHNGQVSPLDITIQGVSSRGAIVSGDLSQNSYVVSAGVSQLFDGMRVSPIVRERGL